MLLLEPIAQFEWTDDYSYHRTLTCVNHPTARYLTKNPYDRHIHCIKLPEGNIKRSQTGECLCPFDDLAVILNESQPPKAR